MESAEDAHRFGREIAGFARERAARLRAAHADPDVLAAEMDRQVERPATRALAMKLVALKANGMSVPVAETWAEGALKGYREGMAEGEQFH